MIWLLRIYVFTHCLVMVTGLTWGSSISGKTQKHLWHSKIIQNVGKGLDCTNICPLCHAPCVLIHTGRMVLVTQGLCLTHRTPQHDLQPLFKGVGDERHCKDQLNMWPLIQIRSLNCKSFFWCVTLSIHVHTCMWCSDGEFANVLLFVLEIINLPENAVTPQKSLDLLLVCIWSVL